MVDPSLIQRIARLSPSELMELRSMVDEMLGDQGGRDPLIEVQRQFRELAPARGVADGTREGFRAWLLRVLGLGAALEARRDAELRRGGSRDWPILGPADQPGEDGAKTN